MTEEATFPIDSTGIDKIVQNDNWYGAGIIAWLASFPAAIYSLVWTIMWIVQDGHGTGTSVQLNWNMDPHLFMLMAFPILCWTFLPYLEGRRNRGTLRSSSNSSRVTGIYNTLTPINQQLAKPVVLKVYELERSGVWNDSVRKAYDQRIKAMEKIKTEQEREIHSALIIDNSDLDAVEYVLKAKKEIANA